MWAQICEWGGQGPWAHFLRLLWQIALKHPKRTLPRFWRQEKSQRCSVKIQGWAGPYSLERSGEWVPCLFRCLVSGACQRSGAGLCIAPVFKVGTFRSLSALPSWGLRCCTPPVRIYAGPLGPPWVIDNLPVSRPLCNHICKSDFFFFSYKVKFQAPGTRA